MKLVVIFDVPDDQADAYADVAARMIQHHAFAVQQQISHWSFDLAMRPVAATAVEYIDDALRVVREAFDGTFYPPMVSAMTEPPSPPPDPPRPILPTP